MKTKEGKRRKQKIQDLPKQKPRRRNNNKLSTVFSNFDLIKKVKGECDKVKQIKFEGVILVCTYPGKYQRGTSVWLSCNFWCMWPTIVSTVAIAP